MKLCLNCRRVSGTGALFCLCCGKSFGCRLCPSLHPNPAVAACCGQCGKRDLTEPTSYVSLGWVNKLIAWATVVAAIRYGIHHAGQLAGFAWNGASWGLYHLLGISACSIVCLVDRVLAWIIVALFLTLFLPAPTGKAVRAWILRTALWAAKTTGHLIRSTVLWLVVLVHGKPAKETSTKKRAIK